MDEYRPSPTGGSYQRPCGCDPDRRHPLYKLTPNLVALSSFSLQLIDTPRLCQFLKGRLINFTDVIRHDDSDEDDVDEDDDVRVWVVPTGNACTTVAGAAAELAALANACTTVGAADELAALALSRPSSPSSSVCLISSASCCWWRASSPSDEATSFAHSSALCAAFTLAHHLRKSDCFQATPNDIELAEKKPNARFTHRPLYE